MALSEDERALLRLLLAGDTYERVAELLGTDAGEVQARAHRAAAELRRERDPELAADAVERRLAVIEGREEAPAPAGPELGARDDRRRLTLWFGLGGAALIAVVVLIVVASGGGGGDDGGTTATSPPNAQEDVVPIKLTPVGGSGASGTIAVVRVADQPAVDLAIRGLPPSGAGATYVLWFVGPGGRSLPVAFQAVGANGELTGRTPIPTSASGLLPSLDTAELTLTRQREAAAAVRRAARQDTLPQPVGTVILRGPLR
jgi:hypothetical protein